MDAKESDTFRSATTQRRMTMAYYAIAHIREKGQHIIIVPLESSFGAKSSVDQQAMLHSLQVCAQTAGLQGTVVPVWRAGGRVQALAPTEWQAFFKKVSWSFIAQCLNKVLACD